MCEIQEKLEQVIARMQAVGGEFLFIRQKAFEKDQYSEVQGVAD